MKEKLKIASRIKNIAQSDKFKWVNRKNMRRFTFLLIPLIAQIVATKSTGVRIPFVLLGAYFPLLFDMKEKKGMKFVFVMGLNILLRFTAVVGGLIFIILGKDFGTYNITIGIIYILLGLVSGYKMSYSLAGILFLNAYAYFALNEFYSFFAIGFFIFLLLEFLFETKLELIPFSKRTFGLKYVKLGWGKTIGFGLATCMLVVMAVGAISVVKPFNNGYANQKQRYERRVAEEKEKEAKKAELINTIDTINSATKD